MPPVARETIRTAIPWVRRALLSVLLSAATALSQEVDTVLFRSADRAYTVLDQLTDPAQRRDLKAVLSARGPERKHRFAEDFLRAYPDSPLLASVSDIAAKTAIDLGDLARGVRHAALSLRILPENPLLLVALADAQASQGRIGPAAANARRALEYLRSFAKPARFGRAAWRDVLPGLQATCRSVLGRAALQEAITSAGARRLRLLRSAEQELVAARRLDPRSASAAYLLGLVSGTLGRVEEAKGNLADAVRSGGPLGVRAADQLRKILGLPDELSDDAMAQVVAGIPHLARPANGPERAQPSMQPTRYSGSESCRACHREVYDSWERTGMARMFRPYSPDANIGVFENGTQVFSEEGAEIARLGTASGRPFMEFRDASGWRRFRVDHLIGSKWQQGYATELPDGRIHVFPIQYSRIERRWLNFWRVIDPPGTERVDAGAFSKLGSATSYQLHCASCHTSQLRAGASMRPANFDFEEPGVNCEMCHGPSADHAEAAAQGRLGRIPGLAGPVRFGEVSAQEYVGVCGQCHMQSNLVEIGPDGEVNFTGDAQDFHSPYMGRPFDEFSTKAMHGDGRFRETTFIGESFVRSACHRVGGAHCGSCHNPHPPDPESNPNSLKHRDDPDRMCLQCHADLGLDLAGHTRHAPESEASRCTSCHMPRIMHALLFDAPTHRIDDIPDAEMTARFGRDRSPNACLLCHADRSVSWLVQELARWPVPRARETLPSGG